MRVFPKFPRVIAMFFTQLQAQWPPVAQLSLCHATDVRIVRLSAMSTKLCAEIVILSWVRCNGTLRLLTSLDFETDTRAPNDS